MKKLIAEAVLALSAGVIYKKLRSRQKFSYPEEWQEDDLPENKRISKNGSCYIFIQLN